MIMFIGKNATDLFTDNLKKAIYKIKEDFARHELTEEMFDKTAFFGCF